MSSGVTDETGARVRAGAGPPTTTMSSGEAEMGLEPEPE